MRNYFCLKKNQCRKDFRFQLFSRCATANSKIISRCEARGVTDEERDEVQVRKVHGVSNFANVPPRYSPGGCDKRRQSMGLGVRLPG